MHAFVYINDTVEFLMFIFVNNPFDLVTGELVGVPSFTVKRCDSTVGPIVQSYGRVVPTFASPFRLY